MGILRKAFVCGALLLAIPTPPDATSTGGAVPPSASTMAYVSAASDTFADVRGFCGRNPQVCATAGIVASRMEAKAKFGARVIYEWANDASGTPPQSASLPKDEAAADPIATGTYTRGKHLKAESQSTLTLQDLIPEWKGPAHKKGLIQKG